MGYNTIMDRFINQSENNSEIVVKLKDSDIDKILKLKSRGVSVRKIAEIFGVSPRRIQQVIKNPRLEKPGRKVIEVSPELEERIVQLRGYGYTIDEIHRILTFSGYKISRYRVWKILKEHRIKKFRKMIEEFGSVCTSVNSVFFIGASPTVSCEDGKKVKFLIICNVRKCEIVYCNTFEKLTLKTVIELFDSIVLRYQKPDLVVLFPTSPLVPTRCQRNRLTNHLENLGISYVWFPEQLKDNCREEIELLKNILKDKCDCSYLITREIQNRCKELLEVSKNEDAKSNKEISKNQDNCRDKEF